MRAAALRLAAAVQSLPPDSVPAILALGLVFGTFPVYGCPTVFCLLAALVFRLNAPALQLVNQVATPLQLALLIPFARLGERLLGPIGAPSSTILSRFGELTLQAIAGWFCLAAPLGLLMYFILSLALRRRRAACFNELESSA